MTNTNDKIANKIRSLLNVTTDNGATEAEAMVAMAKASELMARYHMTENDVVKPEYVRKVVTYKNSYGNGKWVGALLLVIAENNQVWRLLGSKPHTYVLWGTPGDIALTEQFFEYAYSCAKTYGKAKFKKQTSERYVFWNSYGSGFADGVADIFKATADEIGSTAIVLAKLKLVKEAYPTTTRVVKGRSFGITQSGYNQGLGDGKNLRKAVATNVSNNGPKQIGMKR